MSGWVKFVRICFAHLFLECSPIGHSWRAETRCHTLWRCHGYLRIVLGQILQDSDLDEFELSKVIRLVKIIRILLLLLVDLVLHLELKAVLRRHCDGLGGEERDALTEGDLLI